MREMTLLDLPARPANPAALPAFTGPLIPARKKPAAKFAVQTAVRVTAGPNLAPPAAAPTTQKAPARKRTRKFVPDLLAKEVPARHVATLDSFQLNAALDTMFRLDEFAAELEIIARLRSEHPNELIVAERMTGWHLGTVEEFKARAEAKFLTSPAGSSACAVSRAKVGIWATALAVLPVATGASTIAVSGDGALGLAAAAVTALVYVVAGRRPESTGIPSLIEADWAHLRRDVVDASLAAVIKERNQPLTAEEEAALTRGFEHLRHIGLTSAAMAGPSAPVRKARSR